MIYRLRECRSGSYMPEHETTDPEAYYLEWTDDVGDTTTTHTQSVCDGYDVLLGDRIVAEWVPVR